MISVAVTTRDKISGDLRDDALSGESRWERQCIESLLLCPQIDKVYTLDNVCSSESNVFSKFGNKFSSGLPASEYNNTILIGMDFWTAHFENRPSFKGAFFNVFHGLWDVDLPKAKEMISQYGKRIVFTHQFPGSDIGTYLEGKVGKDFLELLPTPGIPEVVECNNFDKDILLWDQKFIFQYMDGKEIESIFRWVKEKLVGDKNKKFVITTGFRPVDLMWHKYKPTAEEQFWTYDCANILSTVRDRVVVLGSVSWSEMLRLHSEAKLPVTFPAQYGGAPLECAMYGLPFIGKNKTSPFIECPDYVSMPELMEGTVSAIDGNSFVGALERLYTDRDYYTKIGSSYRSFAKSRYTYSVFANNFLRIAGERGMLDA